MWDTLAPHEALYLYAELICHVGKSGLILISFGANCALAHAASALACGLTGQNRCLLEAFDDFDDFDP